MRRDGREAAAASTSKKRDARPCSSRPFFLESSSHLSPASTRHLARHSRLVPRGALGGVPSGSTSSLSGLIGAHAACEPGPESCEQRGLLCGSVGMVDRSIVSSKHGDSCTETLRVSVLTMIGEGFPHAGRHCFFSAAQRSEIRETGREQDAK